MEKKRRGEQRRMAEHDKAYATEHCLKPVRAGGGIDEHAERGVCKAEEEGQPARHQADVVFIVFPALAKAFSGSRVTLHFNISIFVLYLLTG